MATPVQIAVLANDSDADNDAFDIATLGTPANGSVTLQAGIVTYTPKAGFAGEDQFSYTLKDSFGATSVGTVRVSVSAGPNRAPVAIWDYRNVSGVTPSIIDVLANDHDPDGDALTIVALGTLRNGNGSVRIENNKVVFTPNKPFTVDYVEYTISDGRGGTATSTIMLVDP